MVSANEAHMHKYSHQKSYNSKVVDFKYELQNKWKSFYR